MRCAALHGAALRCAAWRTPVGRSDLSHKRVPPTTMAWQPVQVPSTTLGRGIPWYYCTAKKEAAGDEGAMRARIFTRRKTTFSKLENFGKQYSKLLERVFFHILLKIKDGKLEWQTVGDAPSLIKEQLPPIQVHILNLGTR